MKIDKYVAVEVKAFGQGMKKMFEGLGEVFSAIGADEPERLELEKAKWKNEGKGHEAPMTGEADDVAADSTVTTQQDDTSATDTTDALAVPAKKAPAETASVEETAKKPAKKKAEPTTITKEDIQKIIVKKVKQDRSNSTKIEQILHAYGASSVSELDTSKYEAFLTDVAAV